MKASLTILLIFAAAWAVVTDLKERRISNRLTFGASAVALGLRLFAGGSQSLIVGAEGWLLGAALLALPFMMGWMGAGDVKLLAAFGAMGGPNFVVQTALASCLVAGGMAVYCLARERKLLFFLRHILIYIQHPFGSVLESKRRMPFGPALAVGALASLVMARGVL